MKMKTEFKKGDKVKFDKCTRVGLSCSICKNCNKLPELHIKHGCVPGIIAGEVRFIDGYNIKVGEAIISVHGEMISYDREPLDFEPEDSLLGDLL